MALSLTVLGRSGSYPGPGQACSGYLVRSTTTAVWVDAGSGSLANLQHHVGLGDVDAIVLSHQHGDHWHDIDGYHVACTYGIHRAGVPVYGPAGLRDELPDRYDHFSWTTVGDADEVEIGDLTFRFARTSHPVETLAMRVDGEGRSLAYSADTGPGWSIEALGEGVNTALMEATYLTRPGPGSAKDAYHLTARQAGEQAAAAKVDELLLTHFWPTNDVDESRAEGSEAFGRAALLAVENETYPV